MNKPTRIVLLSLILLAALLFPFVSSAQVTPASRGGTGTGTLPSFGQVLMGQGNGSYTPAATSSLGFPDFSLPNLWSALQTFAQGFIAQGSSTVAGDFNVTGTSTIAELALNGRLVYNGVTLATTTTGTGSLVLSSSPTFGTTVTTAAVRGGTSATSQLIIRPTTSTGPTTAALSFQGGPSGTVESARMLATTLQWGFGTSTPMAQVQIASSSLSSTFKSQLVLTDSGAGANLKHWGLTSSGGKFTIGPITDAYGTTNSFTIANSGNIGAGTSTPWGRISITQDATAAPGFIVASPTDVPQFLVAASGNVGIGTTSPAFPLEVSGGDANIANGALRMNGIVAISNGRTIRSSGGTATQPSHSFSNTTTTGLFADAVNELGFSTNGVEKMRILSNGNVGIGTATPTSLLTVAGGSSNVALITGTAATPLTLERTANSNVSLEFKNTAGSWFAGQSSNGNFAVGTNANLAALSTALTVTTGGSVGIGATTPLETLHISANETGAGSSLLRLDNAGTDGNETGMEFWAPPVGTGTGVRGGRIYSKFDTASYTGARLTLQSMTSGNVLVDTLSLKNGRVGIGTTAPTATLHVYDGASGLTPLGGTGLTIEDDTNVYLSLLTSSGNKNGILFGNGANTNVDAGIFYNDSLTTRGLQFRTGNNNTRLVIDSAGNVGIGTTSPFSRFHVTSGPAATTTVNFGEVGSANSKACFNTKNTAGADISFYFVGSAMVVESSLCK